MDIAEFLTARCDEEAAALQQIEDHSEPWRGRWGIKSGTLYTYNGWCLAALMVTEALSGRWRPGVLEHIVRYDPARVLADLAAKQGMLALHRPERDLRIRDGRYVEDPPKCSICFQPYPKRGSAEPWPCPTLRYLAAPYVAHPDYDPAWTVDAAE